LIFIRRWVRYLNRQWRQMYDVSADITYMMCKLIFMWCEILYKIHYFLYEISLISITEQVDVTIGIPTACWKIRSLNNKYVVKNCIILQWRQMYDVSADITYMMCKLIFMWCEILYKIHCWYNVYHSLHDTHILILLMNIKY
jgi:hypothetical protein